MRRRTPGKAMGTTKNKGGELPSEAKAKAKGKGKGKGLSLIHI